MSLSYQIKKQECNGLLTSGNQLRLSTLTRYNITYIPIKKKLYFVEPLRDIQMFPGN